MKEKNRMHDMNTGTLLSTDTYVVQKCYYLLRSGELYGGSSETTDNRREGKNSGENKTGIFKNVLFFIYCNISIICQFRPQSYI